MSATIVLQSDNFERSSLLFPIHAPDLCSFERLCVRATFGCRVHPARLPVHISHVLDWKISPYPYLGDLIEVPVA